MDGGAIFAEGAVTIVGSTFTDNTAVVDQSNVADVTGGALSWEPERGALTIKSSTFSHNGVEAIKSQYAAGTGGALYVAPQSGTHRVSISGSTFSGNAVTVSAPNASVLSDGGAIFADGTDGAVALALASTSVAHSTVSVADSQPEAVGGGVAITHASGTFTRATVADNTVRATGGADQTQGAGGGIHADNVTGALRVALSSITGNSLVGQSQSSSVGLNGGGVEESGAYPLLMSRSTVSGNTATETAAESPSRVNDGGLGLESSSSDVTTSSTIANNTVKAAAGPTPVAEGGAVVADDDSLTMSYTTVTGDSAVAADTGPWGRRRHRQRTRCGSRAGRVDRDRQQGKRRRRQLLG